MMSSKRHIVEGRDFSRLLRLDVGVDQVPHVGFVSLQIERLAACVTDHVAELHIVRQTAA